MSVFWLIYLIIGWGFGLATVVTLLHPDMQRALFYGVPTSARAAMLLLVLMLSIFGWPMWLIERYCDNGNWRG